MLRILVFFICSVTCSFLQAQPQKAAAVIFDSDMGPDYDDVGAIALLHALADDGKAEILATIASTNYEGVAAVLNVLNTYFKKPSIPIAVPKSRARNLRDWQHWSDTLIRKYPHTIKSNNDVPEATALYRKILAQQPDNSVTIVTVGFLTNIWHLLQSPPDQYSFLSGKDLVNKKVKQLVSMAGHFPSGHEFNIKEDAQAAKYVFEHWEKPALFSGFEIGNKIKTGLPLIQNNAIQDNPVKDVYTICIPMAKEDKDGRMSWDQTAVLVAVEGYQPFYKIKTGTIQIAADGSNTWDEKGKRPQAYLIEEKPINEMEFLVNQLMMHQPKTH